MALIDRPGFIRECANLCNSSYYPDLSVPPPEGWERLTDSISVFEQQPAGYFGIAYVNHDGRIIAIAHRGTSLDSIANARKNIASDAAIAIRIMPGSQEYANAFTYWVKRGEVRDLIANQAYRVIHIGHSLGGFHASVEAYRAGEMGVAFDDPGAREIVTRAMGPFRPLQARNIFHYHSVPNLINETNTPIGRVVRIQLAENIPLPEENQNGLFNTIKNTGKVLAMNYLINSNPRAAQAVISVAHTLSTHQIERIRRSHLPELNDLPPLDPPQLQVVVNNDRGIKRARDVENKVDEPVPQLQIVRIAANNDQGIKRKRDVEDNGKERLRLPQRQKLT